jgi:deazaflavin-dependent oxidoreductase (nitroreductase family)
VPSDLVLKTMNVVHRSMLRLSGGRVGWRVGDMPVLQLTTTGRKTGRRHSVMLTSPLQMGATIVVVASRGGDDHHPAWFLNLRDQPEVEISMGGEPPVTMRARIARPEERAALWAKVTTAHEGYAAYQTKTDREIPLVLLEPLSSPNPAASGTRRTRSRCGGWW